jgi:hypothetical protein
VKKPRNNAVAFCNNKKELATISFWREDDFNQALDEVIELIIKK